MELLRQLLKEAGADMREAVTFIPSFGAYISGVKRVEDFSEEKIVLVLGKKRLALSGGGLLIAKYFEGDLFVRGDIKGISYE